MRVLGIESSCDDTGVAVYDDGDGLLGHRLASQVEVHKPYGGVVPELAARDHIRKLMPLVKTVLNDADCGLAELDGVAYTAGPGLTGALLVGAMAGRTIAWARDIAAIGIHHMEGHLLSPMLDEPELRFPFLALLVSGGHTLLVDVRAAGDYRILGRSLDDAVGEAFDKTAKLLGLGYPGGPAIAKAAQSGRPERFRYPRPMTDRPGLDFSFSGLKTSVATSINELALSQQDIADVAMAFQQAAVDTLVIKCRRAFELSSCRTLVVAGGVGANKLLRKKLTDLTEQRGLQVAFPRLEFCTDNGAMIAYAGCLRLLDGQQSEKALDVVARWSLEDLPPIGVDVTRTNRAESSSQLPDVS